MSDFRRLFPFIRPYLGKLVLSLLLLVLAGIAEVLTTSLAIPLFDDVLVVGRKATGVASHKATFLYKYLSALPGNTLTQLASALLVLTLIKGVCLYSSNYGMGRVGQSVVTELRNRLYAHVMRQSMGFFAFNSTGKLMSRMGSDVEQLQHSSVRLDCLPRNEGKEPWNAGCKKLR